MLEVVEELVLLMTHLIKAQRTLDDLVLEVVEELDSPLEMEVLLEPMVLMVLLL